MGDGCRDGHLGLPSWKDGLFLVGSIWGLARFKKTVDPLIDTLGRQLWLTLNALECSATVENYSLY